ncbi:hypothetical protein [Methylobacter sp.]|uniref:hypothetical protein n=1 Tax=Methylobacter sp. TaxID=2051955 RepID=UPI0024897BA4|nr:hypothetical protein [Methylobacter sp.]MDI1278053.1 hypothetical protein [Methylobacter sp.]
MAVHDLEQPAKLWLADCVSNLANLVSDGEYPSMNIVVNGVTFEFRVKPTNRDNENG